MPSFIHQNPLKGSFSDEHARAPYQTYHARTSYRTHTGLYGMPIARKHTPGKRAVRIVRLHAPESIRIFTEVVERLGDWPELPKAVPQTRPGEVLQERVVTRFDPILDENGHHRLYRVELMYVFLRVIAAEESDNLSGGVVPFDEAGAARHELPAAAFTERAAAR